MNYRIGLRMIPVPNMNVTDCYALLLLLSALFVNELWFHPVAPLSDIPVWSIGFEFWYYVFFGVIIFAPGKWRYIAVSVVALIAGPRILLLLLIWLLGVAVYQLGRRRLVGGAVGWVFFVLPPFYLGSFLFAP